MLINNKQKKILISALVIILTLALVGCGSESSDNSIEPEAIENIPENSNQNSDMYEIVRSLYGYGEDLLPDIEKLLEEVYDEIPSKCQVPIIEKETVKSAYYGEKEYDNFHENYDYFFNVDFPAYFKEERDGVLELLHLLDGMQLDCDEYLAIKNSDFSPVTTSRDSSYRQYQRVDPNEISDIYYYGSMQSGKPNGQGVLLYNPVTTSNYLPLYAGEFKDGYYCGYGILWDR